MSFANAKATHIFSIKILAYMWIFNEQSFNDTLSNDVVSFEQLDPGYYSQVYHRALWVYLSFEWFTHIYNVHINKMNNKNEIKNEIQKTES